MADVTTELQEYKDHQARLELPNTLMGGATAMRNAGTKYLPKEPAESTKAWEIRRDRTSFFNAFKRTLEKLTGEVFSKDIALGEDVPAQIIEWCENIDLQGANLSRLAKEVFKAALKDGVTHILVDYPQTDGSETRADEQVKGIRPYWVHIRASQVIGWLHEIVNGKKVLMQVRFKEAHQVPDGDYGVKEVNRIRVLWPDRFEVWEEQEEKGKKKVWVLIQGGSLTLGFIPLVTIPFGEPLSAMTALSPLEDLAELNLAHWKLDSDYRQTLHQMVPMWFGKGITDAEGKALGEADSKVVTGAGRLIHSTNTEADLKGIALESGPADAMRRELDAIEEKMALFGLTLMLPKTGQVTATQAGQDKSENDSALRGWALVLKDCLELALQYTAAWAKLDDSGGTVTVNTDFRAFSGIDSTILTQALVAGKIPMSLWLKEMQRRGTIEDAVDETEVLAMLANEQRNLSLQGLAGTFLRSPATGAGI
jgi:hypothetical protein